MRNTIFTIITFACLVFPAYGQQVCPRCGQIHPGATHQTNVKKSGKTEKAIQDVPESYLEAISSKKALEAEKARGDELKAASDAMQERINELEQKLSRLEEETTPKPTTVQPIPDSELLNALQESSDLTSDDKTTVSGELDPAQFPTPSQIEAEPIAANMSASGRWTFGASRDECERVDRIMSEMSDEFGYDLEALDSVWTKFPVCYIGNAGYAGCTYWNGSAVDRINIVSQYDDKTDRVLRHELIHAVLFYLTKNATSLFIHEATTQQAEPGVRNVYVKKMQAALAADKPELSSWVDRNSYDANLRLYTFGYGVSEYLVSLGGKEWYFGFVLDYGKVGFSEALARWYGMSYRQFSDGLHEFYLNNAANRATLRTLIKE